MAGTISTGRGTNQALNIALWIAQVLLAIPYTFFGFLKATQPLNILAIHMKWVPDMAPVFVRTLGTLELLGAVGILLPSLTRIKPRLTVAAAACFTVLQVLAVSLHASRGEFNELGLNAGLICLSVFVLWGRGSKVVIPDRLDP